MTTQFQDDSIKEKNMSDTIKLKNKIPLEYAGLRLDQALAKLFPEYTRARIQQWIKNGYVMLDNQTSKQTTKVKEGQEIIIEAPQENIKNWEGQAIPLNIVYADESIIIINKAAGIVVHPGAGNPDHTLVNALLHYAPELAAIPRAGVVHRLDKETSGLLVIARTLTAHADLIRQLQQRTVQREYQAIVQGIIISGATINVPIGRHPTLRTKMAVTENGKEAITHYRVIERFRAHTLLQIKLETGRTHQIRVHMAHIHHPLIGDPQYSGRKKLPANCTVELRNALQNFPRQALHAWRLQLKHPTTKKIISWEAPLPEDMQQLLILLKEDRTK